MYLKTILLNNNCDLSVLGLIYINNLYFYDDLVRIFKSVNNFIMKELPRNIKRDDILQGIRKIEEEGFHLNWFWLMLIFLQMEKN